MTTDRSEQSGPEVVAWADLEEGETVALGFRKTPNCPEPLITMSSHQQAVDALTKRAESAEARLARVADSHRDLQTAYVRLLEAGRDRIMDLGGECDPVDVMEAADPWLSRARRELAAAIAPQEG